jgi:hypothetical protein
MAAPSLDIEFSKYWSQLTAVQKQSLLNFIRSFSEQQENEKIAAEPHDLELQEAEAEYGGGDYTSSEKFLKQLKGPEKKSLLLLMKSFLKSKSQVPERISIEQYNKELEEAEAEFERGEIYTHEEVIAMSKKWVNGK